MNLKMFLTCAVATLAASVTVAQPTYNTVALSGQQAPGVAAGGVYSSFETPVLNGVGQTAYVASLTGTGITFDNSLGIWSQGGGSLALVARRGSAAPGVGSGGVFAGLGNPILNGAGQTAFYGVLTGNGIQSNVNDTGIWSQGGGSLALVARRGDAAPGVAAGGVFSFLDDRHVFNDAGQSAFRGELIGNGIQSNVNDTGIWSQGGGSLALVARAGDAAPGVAAGGVFNFPAGSGIPVLNGAGQMAFHGRLTGNGVTISNNAGMWSQGGGSLALLAREGDAAPGVAAGGVFNFSFNGLDPVLNGAGQAAFYGVLTGTGITTSNRGGIWSQGGGSLGLVAREGSAAPGVAAGGVFSILYFPVLNGAGQTAFRGDLTGTGIISGSNDQGIWSQGGGSLALVARTGDAAPGVGSGGVFSLLGFPVLNGAGQTAFLASLTGTGITFGNDRGIWATGSDGLTLIVRTGDLFDVDPSAGIDNRIISSIGFADGGFYGSGSEYGRGMAFNDSGLLAFSLSFRDGTSGIFTASVAVPEPSSIFCLFGVCAIAGLFVRERRRISP